MTVVAARASFEKRTEVELHGLGERVTVVKGLHASFAERADGSRLGWPALQLLDREAWRARWGALDGTLVQLLQAAAPADQLDFALLFDPFDGDWVEYIRAQASGGSEAELWRELLRAEIEARGAELAAELEQLGVDEIAIDLTMPLVSGRTTAASLLAIGAIEGASQVVSAASGEGVELSNDVADPADWHGASALSSHTGAGQRAGVIELGVCRVRQGHVFIPSSVSYPTLGAACATSANCGLGVCGDPQQNPPACVGGFCLDGHGTAVTSVLARFVPDADIYYPNEGDAPQGPVCSRYTPNAFSYLASNEVRFVNESHECLDAGLDGLVQDYHSRVSDMLITRAAGNKHHVNNSAKACPATFNSLCVGGVDHEGEMSCFSSRGNPTLSDREEPDVMAYAGQMVSCAPPEEDSVIIAGTSSDIDIYASQGTSYASPAMLGMLMKAQAYCADRGIFLDSVGLRAIARTAGWAANPDGWHYSTPKLGYDHADGTGIVFTSVLRDFCAPPKEVEEGFEYGIATDTIEPRSDGKDTPLPNAAPAYPDSPPQAHLLDQTLVPTSSTPGYRWLDLWDAAPLELLVGDRLRVSFSWDACVVEGSGGTYSNTPNTDYDIFLYNLDRNEGLYASQSNDDVNEGFEVVIPSGWGGRFALLLIWPEGSQGCGGIDRTALTWVVKRGN